MKPARMGVCHLCGRHGKLSFEHVPPRSAFNSEPLVARELDSFAKRSDQKTTLCPFRDGAGDHTLCVLCNSRTGAWYAKAFARWTRQGVEILQSVTAGRQAERIFEIYPLRVLKQVVSMFFSVNDTSLRTQLPELVEFVLSKDRRNLPSSFQICAFFAIGPLRRQNALAASVHYAGPTKARVFSEVAFPPFGYQLVLGSHNSAGLADITHWSKYHYSDSARLPLALPVLPLYNHLPGDFRTADQIEKTVQANKAACRERRNALSAFSAKQE